MCIRVEVPDGTYTLVPDDAEDVNAECNYVEQQDLGQSPEEPKTVPDNEGKPDSILTQFL